MEARQEERERQRQHQQQGIVTMSANTDVQDDFPVQVISFDVGLRHFAFAILEVDRQRRKRRVKSVDLVDLQCRKGNPQKVIDCVIDVLDVIMYEKLDPNKETIVLIECQMTAIMKSVQTVINAYFKISSKYNGMNASTHYMSAKHKLNLIHRYKDYPKAEQSLVPVTKPDAKVTKYKKNKLDSVDFALWLLDNKDEDSETAAKVRALRKKDDVTDAFLMAVYHIEACMFT